MSYDATPFYGSCATSLMENEVVYFLRAFRFFVFPFFVKEV
jgi:hypothetical protein